VAGRIRRHWKGLTVSVVVLLAILVVGVPYAYIHFVEGDQPAPLSLSDVPTASGTSVTTGTTGTAGSTAPTGATGGPAATPASVAGTWTVSNGSSAGYRVHETLAGQSTTAVGRTSAVTGSLTIGGTSVSAATFTVQMDKVTSDKSQRDDQFAGRIMDTSTYPTGTFVLTKPIDLGSIPAVGKTITATATGKLTLHGTTKPVTFTVEAKRTTTSIAVTGDITITYSDYGIDNPSFGGFVSVGSTGTIEFLLVTTKAS
jgi:polyisoprenoid-binding protein YceI